MKNCLSLSSNRDLLARISQAAKRCELRPCLLPKGADTVQEQIDTYGLAVIDGQFPWSDVMPVLSAFEKNGIPILFICSSHLNEIHVQHIYNGICATALDKATAAELTKAMERLLTPEATVISVGDISMDLMRHLVLRNGLPIYLTVQEYELLYFLMKQPGEVCTRDIMLREVWGFLSGGKTRTVDIHIGRLRKKIGAEHIETIPNAGYRFIEC